MTTTASLLAALASMPFLLLAGIFLLGSAGSVAVMVSGARKHKDQPIHLGATVGSALALFAIVVCAVANLAGTADGIRQFEATGDAPTSFTVEELSGGARTYPLASVDGNYVTVLPTAVGDEDASAPFSAVVRTGHGLEPMTGTAIASAGEPRAEVTTRCSALVNMFGVTVNSTCETTAVFTGIPDDGIGR